MVQTKEEKAAYYKAYYQANKEKIAIKKKAYCQANKEKIAAYDKEHYQLNKEKICAQKKEQYKTPEGKKVRTIADWKYRGLLDSDGDNYQAIYERYINTHACNVCVYVFDDSNWRCMDHNHQTGIFRQVLCNKCNVNDRWMSFSGQCAEKVSPN